MQATNAAPLASFAPTGETINRYPAPIVPRSQPVHIERPAGFPPGAPDTSPIEPRGGDLSRYRVSPSNLRGLRSDRNGIYTRVNADQSRNFFARVDGSVYQIGGFDRQTVTWRVLDPRSGKEVDVLERRNGQWVSKEPSMPPDTYPATLRGRILRALDGAIYNTRQALTQLRQSWTERTSSVMHKLFGGGAFADNGKARIGQGLTATLQALEQSKRMGASNLRVGNEGGPNQPSAVAHGDGSVSFSRYTLRNWRDADLNELMVHEHTHTGAGTRDHWYLDRNNNRLANWGGRLSPFTFANAVNNADTLARSSSVLTNN